MARRVQSQDSQLVSANCSLFALIFSLSTSASLLAAAICDLKLSGGFVVVVGQTSDRSRQAGQQSASSMQYTLNVPTHLLLDLCRRHGGRCLLSEWSVAGCGQAGACVDEDELTSCGLCGHSRRYTTVLRSLVGCVLLVAVWTEVSSAECSPHSALAARVDGALACSL